jgi:hypothetical protein
MKYAIGLIVALAGLTLAGCGGSAGMGGVSVPSQVAKACTQSASAAVDAITSFRRRLAAAWKARSRLRVP